MLNKARAFCKRRYNQLRKEPEYCWSHPSRAAAEAMRQTEKKFPDLGTFGVEGFCDSVGADGVSYLNTGDTYEKTICFRSSSERFFIADQEQLARISDKLA